MIQGKEKYNCLPWRRLWYLHWATLSTCPSLFPQQSLLDWKTLSSAQMLTRVQWRWVILFAPGLLTSGYHLLYGSWLQEGSSETLRHLRLHLKHMHMGQQQWSLLRGEVWSDWRLAKTFFPERANSLCLSCSSSVGQWPTSSTLQGGSRVLRCQQQLARKSVSSLLSIWESWCLASRIKRSNQTGHIYCDCCPRGALLSW